MTIRLIASDLDGTIIGADGRISERTRRAFEAVMAEGIHVVFVTGRPHRWLQPVREAFDHMGTVICANGALVYDMTGEEVIYARTIELDVAARVMDLVRTTDPAASFAAETTGGLYLESGFAEMPHLEPSRPLDLGDPLIAGEGIVKLLAKSRTLGMEQFYAGTAPKVADLVSITHSAFDVSLLEMAHPRVDKAATLRYFAAELQISPDQIMAFGDMPNDCQMLQLAGQGYAMASGHPVAIACTELLAPPLAEDGVAQIIEKLLA